MILSFCLYIITLVSYLRSALETRLHWLSHCVVQIGPATRLPSGSPRLQDAIRIASGLKMAEPEVLRAETD